LQEDLAKRETSAGKKLPRGVRRQEKIAGKTLPVLLTGQHFQWQVKMPLRGSDLTLRLAMAVQALRDSGYSLKAACLTVAEYSIKPRRLRMTEANIRSTVLRFIKRHREFFEAQYKLWVGRFRSIQPDQDFWRDLLDDAKKTLAKVRKDYGASHPLACLWHWRIAFYLTKLGQFSKAKSEFQKALKMVTKVGCLARQYGPMVPRVDDLQRAIEECEAHLEGK